MMWHSGDGMGWWMLMGSFWFVLFWGLIIWAITRVAWRGGPPGEATAIEIARRRYARGEITREQFEELRRDLES